LPEPDSAHYAISAEKLLDGSNLGFSTARASTITKARSMNQHMVASCRAARTDQGPSSVQSVTWPLQTCVPEPERTSW